GRVSKRVVGLGRYNPSDPLAAGLKRTKTRRSFNSPSVWNICKSATGFFMAAIGDIHEDHGGINEGVFGVELGCEGAGFVPESVVLNGDRPRASNAPGLFVEFLDGQRAGFV